MTSRKVIQSQKKPHVTKSPKSSGPRTRATTKKGIIIIENWFREWDAIPAHDFERDQKKKVERG